MQYNILVLAGPESAWEMLNSSWNYWRSQFLNLKADEALNGH